MRSCARSCLCAARVPLVLVPLCRCAAREAADAAYDAARDDAVAAVDATYAPAYAAARDAVNDAWDAYEAELKKIQKERQND